MDVHEQDVGGEPSVLGPTKLLEALPDPVVVIDLDFKVVWGNAAAEEQLGWHLSEMQRRSAAELIHPDDAEFAAVSLASVQGRDLGTPIELRIRLRSGQYQRFEVRGRAVDGLVVLVLRDVTERRRWEVAAGDSQLLQAVIDSAPAATILLDLDGRIRGASRALTSLLGHDVELVIGKPLAHLAAEPEVSTVSAELALSAATPGRRSFETEFRHRYLEDPVPMSVTVVNLGDDQAIEGLLVTAVDIGPLIDARTQLEHLAAHDSLTGLLDRVPFRDRLDDALAAAGFRDGSVALLFGDIDSFKSINDVHGHAAGDVVLTEIGRRLRAVVRADDAVCRFGGDEFVILVQGDPAADHAAAVAGRIRDRLLTPVVLPDGSELTVTMSIGLTTNAMAPDAASMLREADGAMYEAKRRARAEQGVVSALAATPRLGAPGGGDLLEELIARHGHRLLEQVTMMVNVLELTGSAAEQLPAARRRQFVDIGTNAASAIRPALRSMVAGIVRELTGRVTGAAEPAPAGELPAPREDEHRTPQDRLRDKERRSDSAAIRRRSASLAAAFSTIEREIGETGPGAR